MTIENGRFLSIEQATDAIRTKTQVSKQEPSGGSSFDSILNTIRNREEPVKFSRHAVNRLSDRGIDLSQEQMQRLNQGKIQAGEKGIQESLILMDQLAFIVNVPNNTVVTAMDQTDSTKSNVFTNIDGAVIV